MRTVGGWPGALHLASLALLYSPLYSLPPSYNSHFKMMAISFKTDFIHADAFSMGILIGVVSLLLLLLIRGVSFFSNMKSSSASAPVPKVPGLPLFGNLLQLKEKKPFKTFTRWAEIYGPVYSIQLASSKMIVLSTTDVAKEAMVTKFSSISTRKLSNALKILTQDKSMVAMSDYDEFHKTVKKYILTFLLGSNAQKRNWQLRESMVENCVERFSSHIKSSPRQAVNFREVFEHELFVFTLKQAIGRDVPSLYVEELGATLSRKEIYHVLVLDMMEGAIEVDWRDFFPYLRWVPLPNNVETKLKRLASRRQVIMKALIREHKNRVTDGWETTCYLDCLLSEAKTLTETHIEMLLWETIIESADTVLVTAEWAVFELAKNPERQERLSREIKRVCGSNKLSEEHFSQLPYLGAVFHETLRKHNPVPIIPLRYVHEDTEIAGYRIPAGSEIAINLYGCNMDKNRWENPEDWNPERFLDDRYDPRDLYKTMAFGGGKRTCAGSLQAMLIAYRAIGRFVQEFEWGIKETMEKDFDTVGLTARKLHPLHTTVKRRVDA